MILRLANSSRVLARSFTKEYTPRLIPATVNVRFPARYLSTAKNPNENTDGAATEGKETSEGSTSAGSGAGTDEAPKESTEDKSAEPNAETAPVETPEDKIANFEKEVKSLKDQILRCYAEEENVRRIARRDVDNAREYANSSFAKAMLEVADDLERGLAAVPAEKRAAPGTDPVFLSLLEGLEMTERNIHKIFSKFGVVKYGTVDEAFDPSLHDALFQIPDPSKPSGTIGQVIKAGYKLKERVIRPAEVGTRFNPEADK